MFFPAFAGTNKVLCNIILIIMITSDITCSIYMSFNLAAIFFVSLLMHSFDWRVSSLTEEFLSLVFEISDF